MKKLVKENEIDLKDRGLKPEWLKHVTFEEIRPSFRHPGGISINLGNLNNKILTEGLVKEE